VAGRRGQHNAALHVLVAAVTAAERRQPMPSNSALAAEIGCARHGVTMAVAGLERRGVLRRIGDGGKRRIMVVKTGAATAEAGE
jgi:DNA-binding MarR family transcriptional regulator